MRRCPQGCRGTQKAPLDESLGREPNQQTSWEVKYVGVLLCLFVPYGLASHLLNQLSGVSVSESSLWRWVQAAGERSSQNWQERLNQTEVPQAPLSQEIAQLLMVIAADGVMVPFRPHRGTPRGKTVWREVKVAVVARLKTWHNSTGQLCRRLVHRRLVALLGNIDALEPRLLWEARHQGLESAPQVVWLCDGGTGFWRLFHSCFFTWAVGILDFYHAAAHLYKAAVAYCADDTLSSRFCFERWRHLLRHGRHSQVLWELTRIINTHALPAPQLQALCQVQAYFSDHRPHIAYEHFESQQFPLGSGLVESACKWLVQQRFKGVGMRWSESGFEHLLLLRVEWVNGRFDDCFPSSPHL